ncbi:hypothetical protein [Enterococcus alishanensis]
MLNKFKLTINDKVYLSPTITKELIVNALKNKETEFIILEPKEPIHTSLYMQYAATIEIRFLSAEGKMRHYSYIPENEDEIIVFFLDYFEKNKVPNIENWTDISASFRPNFFQRLAQKFKH